MEDAARGPRGDAVVVVAGPAEDGSAAALLRVGGETVVARVVRQLQAQGLRVRVVARQEWLAAVRDAVGPDVDARPASDVREAWALVADARAGGMVVVTAGEVVIADAVLERLVAEPRTRSTALTVDDVSAPAVAVAGGRVLEVDAGAVRFGHILRLTAADRAGVADAPAPNGPLPPETVPTVLEACLRAGVVVWAAPVQGLGWSAPRTPTQAQAALTRAATDEGALLAAAVKPGDSPFTTYLVAPWSRHVARWAARRSIRPNHVTLASIVLGGAAAASFAGGTRAALILGAVLLQVAFVADCVDGQLARYTRDFSALGAWLDAAFDRAKESWVYAGLAVGASRGGADDGIWVLALAALALQVVRHFVMFSYGATRASAPLRRSGAARRGSAAALRRRVNRLRAVRAIKRLVVLPIGERFALISLAAATTDARTTFVLLLAWGSVALAYQLAVRTARTMA